MPETTTIDTERPNAGRMTDYILGGFHNFKADRDAVDRIVAIFPTYAEIIHQMRLFLQRATTFMAREQGLERFLHLGAGLPTAGNTHEIVAAINPEARVLYSDIDPITAAYGQEILGAHPRVHYTLADAREVGSLLASPEVDELFGPERRVGFLAVGFFLYLPDEAVAHILSTLYDWAAPGSYLAFMDGSDEATVPEPSPPLASVLEMFRAGGNPVYFRSVAQLRRGLGNWQLTGPGIVRGLDWGRPADTLEADDPVRMYIHCGVAYKRH